MIDKVIVHLVSSDIDLLASEVEKACHTGDWTGVEMAARFLDKKISEIQDKLLNMEYGGKRVVEWLATAQVSNIIQSACIQVMENWNEELKRYLMKRPNADVNTVAAETGAIAMVEAARRFASISISTPDFESQSFMDHVVAKLREEADNTQEV